MTLVELMLALAVSCVIATMALTSLTAAGIVIGRHLVSVGVEDRAWLALAVIVRDLEGAAAWRTCTEARDCPGKAMSREYAMPVLLADDIGWLVSNGLRRCGRNCQTYVDGALSLEVIADVADENGRVRRQPLLQRHGNAVRALEVILTMSDGRQFRRIASRPEPRP